MPYELSWEPHGLYCTLRGEVPPAERLQIVQEVYADPRFGDLRYAIADFIGVERHVVLPQATELVTAMHIGPLLTNPRLCLCAVATHPEVIEDFLAMGRTGLLPASYTLCTTPDEARAFVRSRVAS